MSTPTPPMPPETYTPRHASHSDAVTTDAAGASATAATPPEDTAPAKRKQPPLAIFILGLPVVLCLMLLAFASPAIHSGAKDLPLALSGPTTAVNQVSTALDKAKPGAFDPHIYATEADGAHAVKHRDAIGGIALTDKGVTIQTAAGAGTPYASLMKSLGASLAEQGQKVTYTELAPLPAKDSMGTVMTSAGLPLIFGGMGTAAAMFFMFRGSFGRRALGVLGVATVGGLLASLILRYWLHAVDCSYWLLALGFGLGIAAISYAVLGLAKNLGPAGFSIGAVTMMFIANPISGLATGWQWLPHPWGTIGQFLPVGAAGTVLRSVAYFHGHGATRGWIVLLCWALGGFALLCLGKARKTAH